MSKRKWILLVEDNQHDADLALRALSANHAPDDVVVAGDGEEALECLYGRGAYLERAVPGNPAVVLLDLKMPRVGGLEVLRQIKSDARFKAVPVVVFTSSREEGDLAQCYETGANAYVVKPVEFKQFLTVVEDIRRFWINDNELPHNGARAGNGNPP